MYRYVSLLKVRLLYRVMWVLLPCNLLCLLNIRFLRFGCPSVVFLLTRVFTSSTKYLSSLNFALIFCCTIDHTHTHMLIRSHILLFFITVKGRERERDRERERERERDRERQRIAVVLRERNQKRVRRICAWDQRGCFSLYSVLDSLDHLGWS